MISKQLHDHIQPKIVPKSTHLCSFFLEMSPALVSELLNQTIDDSLRLVQHPRLEAVTATLK